MVRSDIQTFLILFLLLRVAAGIGALSHAPSAGAGSFHWFHWLLSWSAWHLHAPVSLSGATFNNQDRSSLVAAPGFIDRTRLAVLHQDHAIPVVEWTLRSISS
jgi:hypothetical protein